jgi:N-acetylglutamate synthase
MMRATAELDLIRSCEERLINLWPAAVTLMMDGWAVRMAHGYSARANSASALTPGATFDEALIQRIETLFRDAALPPCVRVSPLAASSVAPMLAARGYRLKDRAIGMVLPLTSPAPEMPSGALELDHRPTRAWAEAISALQEPSKRSPDHLLSIVGAIRLPTAFATLSVADRPAGFGYCGVDRGLAEIGSIMIHPDHRGQGLGRQLMQGLIAFAGREGATMVFLQVAEQNEIARQLYRAMGFRDLYVYDTLVL